MNPLPALCSVCCVHVGNGQAEAAMTKSIDKVSISMSKSIDVQFGPKTINDKMCC